MLGLALALLMVASPASSLDDLAARLEELAVRDARIVLDASRTAGPILIVFADRHCYPCLQMVEVFAGLRERFPRGISLFLVDPQRADPATALLLSRYAIWATPMTVLVDKSGRVTRKFYGFQELPALAKEADRLLGR